MKSQLPKSSRKFSVFVLHSAPTITERFNIQLSNILEPKGKPGEDYEYIYALGEILDKVLDLQPLDCLRFKADRDNPLINGLIVRTE